MTKGEGLLEADKKIKALVKHKPDEFYFDIVHTANQTPTALQYLPLITQLISKTCKIPTYAITVSLNTTNRILRARNKLYEKAYQVGAEVKETVDA